MGRTALIYGGLLALGALGLQWLQFRLLVMSHATELFVGIVAVAFLALGVWVGHRLFRRARVSVDVDPQAGSALGISGRELQVLELLAGGRSNKEIARQLELSPNTVKSHVANLFAKLAARRRTEAIARARVLGLIR
jgi:DNA-binding CsgD family transcriptional regulator